MSYVTGQFTRLVHQAKNRRYSIYEFRTERTTSKGRQTIKAVYQGWNAPEVNESWYTLKGDWNQNRKYGTEFYITAVDLTHSFRERHHAHIDEILATIGKEEQSA